MAKRFTFIVRSSKELVKHLQSTSPKAAIIRSISNTHMHTQGSYKYAGAAKARDDDIGMAKSAISDNKEQSSSDMTWFVADAAKQGTVKATEVLEGVGEAAKGTAWDAAKNTAKRVLETTTAEADTNVVDTVEYRSAEDLNGQLGDGCDK